MGLKTPRHFLRLPHVPRRLQLLGFLFWSHETGPEQKRRLNTGELHTHRFEIFDLAAQHGTAAVAEQLDDRSLSTCGKERGLWRSKTCLFHCAAQFSPCVEKQRTVEDFALGTKGWRP